MLLSYPVLIKRDERNNLQKVIVPDLNKEIINEDLNNLTAIQLLNLVKIFIKEYLDEIHSKGVVFCKPKKLKEYKDFRIGSNDIWTKVYIEFEPVEGKGYFERWLPKLGIMSAITTAISASITAILAIQLSAGSDNKSLGNILGISGAIIDALVTYLYYKYSNASSSMANYGKDIDKYFTPQSSAIVNVEQQPAFNKAKPLFSSAYIFSRLGVSTLLVGNYLVDSIRIYQEVDKLGESGLENGTFIASNIIKLAAIMLIISNTVSGLAYGSSYMSLLALDIENWLADKLHLNKPNDNNSVLEFHQNQSDEITVPYEYKKKIL